MKNLQATPFGKYLHPSFNHPLILLSMKMGAFRS